MCRKGCSGRGVPGGEPPPILSRMSSAQRLLAFLVVLSSVAIALRAVSQRSRIPYPVVLATGGVVIGLVPEGRPAAVGPDLILLAFVPGLVFQAALTLDLTRLRRLLAPVGLLATVGVVAGVMGVAAAARGLMGLAWPDALLLGAILAPTDPIAVVSVLRTIPAPPAVITVLEGESLLNDATGVAVFAALLASISGGSLSPLDVGLRLLITAGVGVLTGLAWGGLALVALRTTREAQLEFLATLTLAYGSYLTADVAHGSGIVAVVTAAVVVVLGQRRLPLHGDELVAIWDVTGFILNALVFLLIGSALPSRAVISVIGAVALGFLALTAVRAISALAILAATDPRAHGIPWRARPLVIWGGMRGALSVALALSLSGHAGGSPRVAILAYGIVVASLLLQGSTVRPVLRLSRLGQRTDSSP